MVKVENKETLRLLTSRFMKMNRARNIIAVIAIMLTSLLFTSLFVGSVSMILSKRATEIKQFMDSAHASAQNLSEEDAKRLQETIEQSEQVERYGSGIFLGAGMDERFGFSVEVRYADENMAESFNCLPTTGRLPEKENEVALSSMILENLGVKITSSPEQAKEMINSIGISFLFAQSYHGSMRFVGPSRRETGIRTVFNILGPLANPANTNYILLGVYDKELLKPMGEVLINLGIKRAMLVYGNDKLDEISISDNTSVCEIQDNEMTFYELNPEDYGFSKASKKEVVGGTAEENAQITLGILNGKIRDAKRDIVLLNAGCALYVCGKAESIKSGIELAAASIDGGWAAAKLNQLIEKSNSF